MRGSWRLRRCFFSNSCRWRSRRGAVAGVGVPGTRREDGFGVVDGKALEPLPPRSQGPQSLTSFSLRSMIPSTQPSPPPATRGPAIQNSFSLEFLDSYGQDLLLSQWEDLVSQSKSWDGVSGEVWVGEERRDGKISEHGTCCSNFCSLIAASSSPLVLGQIQAHNDSKKDISTCPRASPSPSASCPTRVLSPCEVTEGAEPEPSPLVLKFFPPLEVEALRAR
jgi:hypothetical protein